MKKLLKKIFLYAVLATLLSPILCTKQINSYFMTGTILLKNEQLVVLLGDLHIAHDLAGIQREEIINFLKRFDQTQTLALIEDMAELDVKTKELNLQYNLATEILDQNYLEEEGEAGEEDYCEDTPMNYLCGELRNEHIDVINIEHRPLFSVFQEELVKHILNPQHEPIISINNVTSEIQENLTRLSKYVKKIYKSNIDKTTLVRYTQILSKTNDSSNSFCRFLQDKEFPFNNIQQLPPLDTFLTSGLLYFKINYFDIPLSNTLDLITIYKILKHKNKKIIVVCAGAAHISKIKKFLTEVDYLVIKEIGASHVDKQYDIKNDDQLTSWLMQEYTSQKTLAQILEEEDSKEINEVKEDIRKYPPISIAELLDSIMLEGQEPITLSKADQEEILSQYEHEFKLILQTEGVAKLINLKNRLLQIRFSIIASIQDKKEILSEEIQSEIDFLRQG